MCFPLAAAGGPLGLPDSARPGAVRPEEVGRPTIPQKPAEPLLEIPAVIDRPLEVEEGPVVVVSQFRLTEARDLPKHDVRVSEIEALLSEQAAQRPEGFTMGQLQEVANQVTAYYRQRGLILAQATLPVQTIEAGVVDIQVFEGKLGRVLAEGNEIYDAVLLQLPFKGLIGEPITKKTIETALLTLTDYPGLTVFGVFQPGQQVGTADIVLRVQEEKRFDIAFRVDNHGLAETGRLRFRPTIEWNNVTATADKLTATVQQTYNPKNNDFLAFDYERYFGHGFQAGATFNRNKFDVAGEIGERQQVRGKTELHGLWLDRDWFRSRQFNLATRLALDLKQSRTFARGRLTNRDRLTILSLEGTMDHVDTRFRGIDFATVDYSRGFNDVFGAMGDPSSTAAKPSGAVKPSRRGGSGRFAGGQFDKVFATASRLQTLTPNTYLLARSEYQWSDDVLVPMEQYSVGGPDNVRAFPQAQFLLDRALFFSVELIQNMPFITDVEGPGNRTWGELIQLSAFYDHAIGRLNDPLQSEDDSYLNFRGAGVQVRFTLPGSIESRIMAAWELGGHTTDIERRMEGGRTANNDRYPQLWGDLTYRF
ncbi:MAG: ShlB/FhaC/HecB family hemolysin secretion/activation protein [Gammaproteobacteria bacterium]|nr:ShlB/FhaC/HecB family hemolysin secretion/activation protein [Gammaproteobacteria bacterium]